MLNILRLFQFRKAKADVCFLKDLSSILGYKPSNEALYLLAFTHKSYRAKDFSGNKHDYSRLEFLGDAVLNAIVSRYLYVRDALSSDGELTEKRTRLVMRKTLNSLAQNMNLARFVRTTVPIESLNEDFHGDIFEALVGAVFMDKGFQVAEKFIFSTGLFKTVPEDMIVSYKSLLIKWCQKHSKSFRYNTQPEDLQLGLHPSFVSSFFLDGEKIASANASSKKKAEEQASRHVCETLKI